MPDPLRWAEELTATAAELRASIQEAQEKIKGPPRAPCGSTAANPHVVHPNAKPGPYICANCFRPVTIPGRSFTDGGSIP